MRHHPLLCGALLFFCTAAGVFAQPQPSWQLLGLSDRSINCILADDTTLLFAGTDSGLSVYCQNTWYDIDVNGLPVTCMARITDSVIAVGAGNGSRSDAVYIGTRIDKEPYCELRFQQYFLEPTAMTINNTMAIPRLYVGGRNTVSIGIITVDTLYPFQPLKIPAYAFGVEKPRCADLVLFGDTTLYAGGYDQSTIMGGPGNLLILIKDSLEVARRLDVTALAQGSFVEVGPLELVIGTRDSGVFFYSSSLFIPWTVIPGPTKDPINDLVTMPGMMFSDMLVAAVASGVYTSGGHSSEWTAVGSIPATPNCLAVRGRATGSMEGVLMAGTSKGVYLYALPSAIRDRRLPETVAGNVRPVIGRNGEVLLFLPVSLGRTAEVAVYTVSGKLYTRVSASQSMVRLHLQTAGLFYYSCTVGGKSAYSGVILNVR